jgi:hypothetical protein
VIVSATASDDATTRRRTVGLLGARGVCGNVQHNLEFQQRRTGRDRV